MTFGLVLQVVVTGIAAGAAYGLVAIGFSLVYRLTGVLNLAHGDLVGVGVFAGLVAAAGTAPVGQGQVGVVRTMLGITAAVVVASGVGLAVYLLAVRPFFDRGSPIGWIGATAAVAFALEGALAASFSRQGYVFPDLFRFASARPVAVAGAVIPLRTLWVLGVGAVVAIATDRVLRHTQIGLAWSAIADEPTAAALSGIPVQRLVALAFVVAGALAAIAGAVVTPSTAVDPQTGLVLGLKGIAAALLAGFGSPRRVFGAGLALGVFEGAVASLHVPGLPALGLGPAWRDIAPLLVVIAALAWRPPRLAREPVE